MPITRVIIDPEDFFDLLRLNNKRTEDSLRILIFGNDGSGTPGVITTTSTTTTTTTTIPNVNVSVDWNNITNTILEYTLRFYQLGILKHLAQYPNPTGTETNPFTLPQGTYDIAVNIVTLDGTTDFTFRSVGVSPNFNVNFHQSYVNTFFNTLLFTSCQFILDQNGPYTTTTSTTTTTTSTSSTTTTSTTGLTTTSTSTTTTTTSTVGGITIQLSMTNVLHDRPVLGYELFNTSDVLQEQANFGNNIDGNYIISNFTLPFKIKLTLLDTSIITSQGHYNIKLYRNFSTNPSDLLLDQNILLGYDGYVVSDMSGISNGRNITAVINQIDDVAPTTTSTTTTTTTSTTTTSTTSTTTSSTTTTTSSTTTSTTTTTTSSTTTTTTTIPGDFTFMAEINGNDSDDVEVFLNFETP